MIDVIYLVGALTAPFPAEAHYLVPDAIQYYNREMKWCVEKPAHVPGYVQIKRVGDRLEILTSENVHSCTVEQPKVARM